MFEDFLNSDFANNVTNLGLSYLDKTYINKPQETSPQKIVIQRQYEQAQQRAQPTPVKSPLDNKLIIYGGAGAVVLLTLVVLLKGK